MSASKSIRLLTFNVAHGRGLSPYQGLHSFAQLQRNLIRIARFLDRHQVDIAALQEVDEDSHWNRRINMLEVLRDNTALNYAVMGLTNRRHGPKPLNYGNGLLSRHPVCRWNSHAFGTQTCGGKGFMYVEIDCGEHSLGVVNLHLCFRSRRRRLLQVEQLIDFLDNYPSSTTEHPIPPIVCGDFNTEVRRDGDAVERLFRHLDQTHNYQIHPRSKRTFPSLMPSRALDFVLLPQQCRVRNCEVLPSYLSDHRPVLVEFQLAPIPVATVSHRKKLMAASVH